MTVYTHQTFTSFYYELLELYRIMFGWSTTRWPSSAVSETILTGIDGLKEVL